MKSVENVQQLGAYIRLTRKQQGLTQAELATISGIGIRFIRELEQGKESCHLGKAITIMSMLGLHLHIRPRAEPMIFSKIKAQEDRAAQFIRHK